MIRVLCKCAQELKVPDDCAGRRIRCKRCNRPLRVPPAASPSGAAGRDGSPALELLPPAPQSSWPVTAAEDPPARGRRRRGRGKRGRLRYARPRSETESGWDPHEVVWKVMFTIILVVVYVVLGLGAPEEY